MIRVLVIGDEERRAAAALLEFAHRPENHYRPPHGRVPGDDERYLIYLCLGQLRCVYSVTEIETLRRGAAAPVLTAYRHLSLSLPPGDKAAPHPAIVEEVGHLLGFEGKLGDWIVDIHEHADHPCIVVAQDLHDDGSHEPLTIGAVLRDAVDESLRAAPTLVPFVARALGVAKARVTVRALRVPTVDGRSMVAVEALVDGRDLSPDEERKFLDLMRGPLGQISVVPSGRSAGSS